MLVIVTILYFVVAIKKKHYICKKGRRLEKMKRLLFAVYRIL